MELRIEETADEFLRKRAQGDPRLSPYAHLFVFSVCSLPPAQVYTVSVSIKLSDNRAVTEIVSIDYRVLNESPAPGLVVYSRVEEVLLRLVARGRNESFLMHAKDAERLMVAVRNADSAFEEK